jgi:hypothetical protein
LSTKVSKIRETAKAFRIFCAVLNSFWSLQNHFCYVQNSFWGVQNTRKLPSSGPKGAFSEAWTLGYAAFTKALAD